MITGGAGFIGSHLAEALATRGDEVVVLDDLSTGRRENLAGLAASGAVDLIEGSVTDAPLVDRLIAGCDCCFHLASTVGVYLVVAQPLGTLRSVAQGAEVVVSSASRHGTRLVFASTSEVYGKNSTGALREDSDRVLGSVYKCRWAYAIAKCYGEELAFGYHRERGARTSVARLFNTIGPRQLARHGMVVPRLVRQAIAGDDMTVYGDGTQVRCFLHVDDAVAAIIALSEHEQTTGRAFNVGNPAPITVLGLAERIIQRAGSTSRITLIPYGEAYDDGFEELGERVPDITSLQALVDWKPRRDLDATLDDVIRFERAELALDAEARTNGGQPTAAPASLRAGSP